ncbi:MAG: hypothetical protein HY234_01990 [Acidobacteria bacterium]|nr:hypothetical protein [Acidobacteriota bacterium]
MAKYSALLGRRVRVQYRAGDVYLPASGTLAADSGKSIFLEERFEKDGSVRTFRWEIPYQCIVRVKEIGADSSAPPSEWDGKDADGAPRESRFLSFRRKPETA